VLLLSSLLAACSAIGTKVEEGQLVQFVRGQTTYYEVVATLGKPNQTMRRGDGTRQVIYSYAQTQLKAENFFLVVAAFEQGQTAETTQAVLEFDARDVLLGYTWTQSQTKAGSGFTSGGRQ
jgi:hypothetical protein